MTLLIGIPLGLVLTTGMILLFDGPSWAFNVYGVFFGAGAVAFVQSVKSAIE